MRPRDETRFFYAPAVECVQQQRLQMAAQPVMHRDVESLFLPGEDALRQLVLHQVAEEELQGSALNAVVSRKSGREFDDAVIEEALQFVVEADLLVGGAQPACRAEGEPADSARDNAGASGVGVSEIGDVATEELVGALATESDGYVSGGHSREVPDGNGSSVGVGLIGVVGKLGNRFRSDARGPEIELLMIVPV